MNARTSNPFTPSFGIGPPVLVNRGDLLKQLELAVNLDLWAPSRATFYTGARGSGKTVMLNEAEDIASRNGWVVFSESARPGLIDRLCNDHLAQFEQQQDPRLSRQITAVSTPIGGAEWDVPPRTAHRGSFRFRLEAAISRLEPETGLMITIDEIQRNDHADMVEFASVFQHLARREAPIAFVAAGLPHSVDEVLDDDAITFLRRADRHELKAAPMEGSAAGIAEPIRAAGRTISDEVAFFAASQTAGYPYLIQLVGYHSWDADPDSIEVTIDAVERGAVVATARLGELVHEPVMRDLSSQDRVFLKAMSVDEGPTRVTEIAQRMNRDASYVGQYRRRLIAADVINPAGHGLVEFSMPHFVDHVRSRSDIKLPTGVAWRRKGNGRSRSL